MIGPVPGKILAECGITEREWLKMLADKRFPRSPAEMTVQEQVEAYRKIINEQPAPDGQ